MPVETMQIDSDSRSDDEESLPYPGDNPAVQTVVQEIKEHTRQIEKAVINKEPRFILRILRMLPETRRKLTSNIIRVLIADFYTYSSGGNETLLDFIDEAFVDFDWVGMKMKCTRVANAPLLPEVDAYLHLLVLIRLLDTQNVSRARSCSDMLMSKLTAQNRRSLDLIAAKCFFYHSLAYERTDSLVSVRALFHARLRTATLRNDFEGQAVLINCLLRNYLHYNLYDQADKLVSKVVYPESASNSEWARFLYYLGRIKAARLEYSEAHKHLVQALRKAPQHAAIGFRQAAQKLLVCVDLLLGDIPDKQIFRQYPLRKSLSPYFCITQTVREGNIKNFSSALSTYSPQFRKDRNYALITRLRHNVLKTAVRTIGASYTRISAKSIARILGLDSPEDAEFIIAKAIRDGVIEARLDPLHGYMQSNEVIDIYRTREPQLAFHKRISFCLDLHNQSVKAMRYPPKSYGKDLESAEERREREQQDLELAKEMAEEDDDVFP